MGLLGGDDTKVASQGVIIIVSLLGIFWALFYDFFSGVWILPEFFSLNSASQGSLLTILIFVVVLYFVVGGGEGKEKKTPILKIGD